MRTPYSKLFNNFVISFMKIKYIASISTFTQRYKTQTQPYSSFLMAYSDWVKSLVVFLPYNSLLCRILFRGSSFLDFKYRNTYDSILSYSSEAVVPDTAVCVFTTYFPPTISYEPTCPLRTVRGMLEFFITGSSSHRFHWRFATKPASRSGFFHSTRASGYSLGSVRKPSFTPAFTTNSWQI